MVKVLPALETYMMASIVTGELMGTNNPFVALLGDLNPNSSGVTGPAGPQVLTLKELLLNTADRSTLIQTPTGNRTVAAAPTSAIAVLTDNFQNNWINIVWRTAATTAGFRIANKVLSKPKNKINKMLRQAGLGSTVQI